MVGAVSDVASALSGAVLASTMKPVPRKFGPLDEKQRELVANNMALALFVVNQRTSRIKILDRDELLELAWIGLCIAAQRHIPEKTKFGTYAYICINSEINRELKHLHRACRRPSRLCHYNHMPKFTEPGALDNRFAVVDAIDSLENIARKCWGKW